MQVTHNIIVKFSFYSLTSQKDYSDLFPGDDIKVYYPKQVLIINGYHMPKRVSKLLRSDIKSKMGIINSEYLWRPKLQVRHSVINNGNRLICTAEIGDIIIGFCDSELEYDKIIIKDISIHPLFRSKGLKKNMMSYFLSRVRRLHPLPIQVDNIYNLKEETWHIFSSKLNNYKIVLGESIIQFVRIHGSLAPVPNFYILKMIFAFRVVSGTDIKNYIIRGINSMYERTGKINTPIWKLSDEHLLSYKHILLMLDVRNDNIHCMSTGTENINNLKDKLSSFRQMCNYLKLDCSKDIIIKFGQFQRLILDVIINKDNKDCKDNKVINIIKPNK